jgi:hypothetical protein
MASSPTLLLAVLSICAAALLGVLIHDWWRARMKYYKNAVGRYSAHHSKHPLDW